ncbi:ribonuclease H2, subunit B [Tribonema minus]|uniref:Ribonuclease H2, subunit B n=1 Tax=Tribonema minus TaxID=303371 RepID=A0A835YS23_9STRA|nr:ribonuclease H2, subunit B [Tribonema minus]
MAHPRTGEKVKWLLRPTHDEPGSLDVLELQVTRVAPTSFCSFFVGQAVQSDGAVYMATRVDPALLLLPLMTACKDRWIPLGQQLQEARLAWLLRCRHLGADKICDVNDRLGPDLMLYRLNEAKALAWLLSKVDRVAAHLDGGAHGGAAADDANAGAVEGMAAGFSGNAAPNDAVIDPAAAAAERARARRARLLRTALEIVCDYVPAEWAERVAARHDATAAALLEARGGGGIKRKAPATAWEACREEDRNLSLSLGNGNKGEAGGKKAKAPPAKSKLAKVNTKGMKSLATLFGKQQKAK